MAAHAGTERLDGHDQPCMNGDGGGRTVHTPTRLRQTWLLLRILGLGLLVLLASAVLPPGQPALAIEPVLIAQIPTGTAPKLVAVDAGPNRIYVANDTTVSVIDGITNAKLGDIPLSTTGVNGLVVNATTHTIYVSHKDANRIDVISRRTSAWSTTPAGRSRTGSRRSSSTRLSMRP